MMLADLGAEVLKVERPTGGDDTRACESFCIYEPRQMTDIRSTP